MTRYDYRIAAGHSVALGSLTNIENIVPAGERALYPPASYGTYSPGQYRIRGDGTVYVAGYPSVLWPWRGRPGGYITYGQAKYLRELICGSGGWSGKATIYTTTVSASTYERYNCVAVFPQFAESEPNFKIFAGFAIRMTRLVAL